MRAVEVFFAVVWAAFWLYWLVAAFSMKRGRVPWSRELGIRAVIVVLVILLFRFGVFRHHAANTDLWLAGAGLVLFAAGLGFAIWARMHIGRNWGTPMTQKDEPELVTSGPYHLVRHPIYSGILVAGVSTAVALSWLWLIAVALAGVYFIYSAKVEEHYLTERFPDAYPVYKRSTKMLVPLILLSGSAGLVPARTAAERETRRACHPGNLAGTSRRRPLTDRPNGPPPADQRIRH
jgi:protein-S-isoprenylcysteine O-methyltransferase Ste14